MLLSMTSYGRATASLDSKNVAIELKTLNSKFVDIRLKVPPNFHEKELWLRKYLQDKLIRGKIEVVISFENEGGGETYAINRSMFRQYYDQITDISAELNLSTPDLVNTVIRLPEVVASSEEPILPEDWQIIVSTLDAAVDRLMGHRSEEGRAIEEDLEKHVRQILRHLSDITPFEVARVEKVRQRMDQNLNDYLKRDNVDENRFEQEVLFYLEKMDITEEKVRLQQHCQYFLEEMASTEASNGRKLIFISQEIGREINTLGAKGYSSDIQKLVVLMKDELEKIKEQLANVV